ncbi:MAG: alpha/beta hydrolase [Bacteroidia bacterium]
MEPSLRKLEVKRTANVYLLGEANGNITRLWLVLHGYAQHPAYWIKKFGPLAQTNQLVVAPEGLSKFYMQGNNGKVGASWMTKDERADEIKDYLNYLNQLITQLKEEFPQAKIVLLGFSQGGATAARLLSENPVVHALIIWSAVFPEDLLKPIPMHQIPTWLVYGMKDPYLQAQQREELLAHYRQHLPALKLLAFEGGHDIDPTTLLQLQTQILEYC